MSTARLYQGDVREVLRQLPERSVQMVCTSPPYWGLRDYGTALWDGGEVTCAHRGKGRAVGNNAGVRGANATEAERKRWARNKPQEDGNQYEAVATGGQCVLCGATRVDAQLGLERTPEEYVAAMVEVFREVKRVLRDDGTCWLNLGDSYAGSWGNQGRKPERGTQRPINTGMLTPVHDGRYPSNGSNTGAVPPGLKPKDLVMIPARVALALQADGWWLRCDIIWSKPNPMPESVTDRPTRSHEYLFLLSKSPTYYYDDQAIAEPVAEFLSTTGKPVPRHKYGGVMPSEAANGKYLNYENGEQTGRPTKIPDTSTRNARSVWTIATQPYPAAHFATFPEELARRCILAGSSNRACEHCGAPWERVTESERVWTAKDVGTTNKVHHLTPQGPARNGNSRAGNVVSTTTGWQPTCSCENQTGSAVSTVLDPFGGSGTVASVATGQGRNSIYIDLNPKYLELARQRIGPMLCEGVA